MKFMSSYSILRQVSRLSSITIFCLLYSIPFWDSLSIGSVMAEYIGVEKFIAFSPFLVFHVCPVCISLWHSKDAGWFKESMTFITIRFR